MSRQYGWMGPRGVEFSMESIGMLRNPDELTHVSPYRDQKLRSRALNDAKAELDSLRGHHHHREDDDDSGKRKEEAPPKKDEEGGVADDGNTTEANGEKDGSRGGDEAEGKKGEKGKEAVAKEDEEKAPLQSTENEKKEK